MSTEARAPAARHVVWAIAGREIRIARRRRLVRWLFGISLMPPIVMATILVVRMVVEEAAHIKIPFDPVLKFLEVQSVPVALLALGLGTPIISMDRNEDVLFLYATRPVRPWHYALGKVVAVGLPAAFLLVVPGILMAVLRAGIVPGVGLAETLVLCAKVAVVALLAGAGFAGLAVGASAVVRQVRWSVLIALGVYFLLDGVAAALGGSRAIPLGPGLATEQLVRALMGNLDGGVGAAAAFVLAFYGLGGVALCGAIVRSEMTP